MQLYLVRHGDAVDGRVAGVDRDDDRWLTDEGREETRWGAEILQKLGVEPDLIMSSPLVRARQTAEIIADVIGKSDEIVISDHLVHGGAFQGILQDIQAQGSPKRVILTGHMPSIGELIGWLTWNDRLCAVRMRTAGIARVDLPDDRIAPGWGDLRWLLPPKAARKLR